MIQEKEAWEEDEMEESDWVTYQWDKTKSKQKILQLKQKINQVPAISCPVYYIYLNNWLLLWRRL